MENILKEINIINNRLFNITELMKLITSKHNRPLKKNFVNEFRDKIQKYLDHMDGDKKLIHIGQDGYCLYSSIAQAIYKDQKFKYRTMREITTCMVRIAFGNDFYNQFLENVDLKKQNDELNEKVKELYDYLSNEKNIIELKEIPIEFIGENVTIVEFWEEYMLIDNVIKDIKNYESIKNKELKYKVASLIRDFMKGLPEISSDVTWGDNIVIPKFAGYLYEKIIIIYSVTENDNTDEIAKIANEFYGSRNCINDYQHIYKDYCEEYDEKYDEEYGEYDELEESEEYSGGGNDKFIELVHYLMLGNMGLHFDVIVTV